MSDKNDKNFQNIVDINYEQEMAQSYIDYAMSVIGDRALPDVRDGLKPVQRRILYSMKELKNYPDKPFKKSARIVGDTMGKYHPHGDCLRWNTKVLLTSGEIKTIKELYEIGENQEIYAINKDGEIIKAIAHSFRIGQKTNNIYQILLDNGYLIETTDNHPFLKHNLQYSQAKRLKVLDKLYSIDNNDNKLNIKKEELVIQNIQIKNVILEDMYDFTVDEHENMLIVADDDNKYLIPVHNSSIYDAMARMSQDFILQSPLVEGHGNFGSIDGDRPAAARYCVTGDTLIPTDKGIMPIKDICKLKPNSEKDISINIQSVNSKNKAIKIFNSGFSDIIEIITDDGNILKGSPNHPILITKTNNVDDMEWVLLEDLKVGDNAIIKLNNIQNTTDKYVLDKIEIKNIIKNLDPKLEKIDRNTRRKILRSKNIEQNYLLALLFSRFAFIDTTSILIRGSSLILNDIQNILLNTGVWSFINYLDNNKAVLKIYGYNNLLVFYKKIGFMMNNKKKHLNINLKDIKANTESDDFIISKIKTIKKLDKKQEIFSLKVDSDCHSFVSNGFVSHNTEARLSPLALNFLDDLDKNVVDMKKNFDESLDEPTVLPVKFPNLLVNGSSGIAVGMTTDIPPHNLKEVCQGAIKYLENPNIILSDLLKTIKGPDFPTGGIITNKNELNKMYKTGEGRLVIRSKINVEDAPYGRINFVITEVPYNFAGNKERLINNIMDTAEKGELDEIIDIRDESNAEGIRIVIETKKGVDKKFFINKLYTKTQAQMNYRYAFNVIVDKEPKTLGLLEYFQYFTDFQKEIYTRKYKNNLNILKNREETLEGLLIAINNLDAVIETIRGSSSITKAKNCLMRGDLSDIQFKRKTSKNIASKFNFTTRQAEAILDMKLQRLVGMEKNALEKELKEVKEEIKTIENILKSEDLLNKEIIKVLNNIANTFGKPRKTKIIEDELEEVIETIEEEMLYILYDNDGYIKAIDENSFSRINETNLKDFRLIKKILNTETLYFFTEKGDLHQLKVLDIPKVKARDKGENIYNIFDIKNDQVIKILSYPEKNSELFFATKNGYVKKVKKEELVSNRKTVIGTKLRKNDKLVDVIEVDKDSDIVVLISKDGYALKFSIDEVNTLGKNTIGTKGMNLSKDDFVIKAFIFNSNIPTDLNYYVNNELLKQRLNSIRIQSRNRKGTRFCEKDFKLIKNKVKI